MTFADNDRILYGYFRSSASYRVRIALNLKHLGFHHAPVHLLRDGGEQFHPSFAAINPQALVPVLRDQGTTISQSLAIIEYLEETYPLVPLLPAAPADRAHVRQLAQSIACEIHPLNNLRVLKYLSEPLGVDEADKHRWIAHWIQFGFSALETELNRLTEPGERRFCVGDTPTVADCCLVPQVFNALRFKVDLSAFPTLVGIAQHCNTLEAFRAAAPDAQPDRQ